jgi:hypothetical protein
MKRSALALFIFFISSASVIAQIKDTTYSESKVNGMWQKTELDIFSRNEFCSVTSLLQENWDESSQSWVNSFFSTYDSTTSGTRIITQSWDALNTKWVNYSQALLFDSKDGSQRTYQYQTWDAASGSWLNNYRLIDKFDDKGRSVISEMDLYSNNQWQKLQRDLASFDANNRLTESIFQMWMNNAWVNNNRTTNNYTTGVSSNDLWNVGNKQWTKFQRSLNDYIANTANTKKSLGQLYSSSDSTWQNNYRSHSSYNHNNQMFSTFEQFWDATQQAWINALKVKIDYYGDGNQKRYEFEGWDGTTNTWGFGYRSTSTDISCSQSLQFVPVARMKNNTGLVAQNDKLSMRRMPDAKTNADNTIKRVFNPGAGNRNTLVYDFTFNANQSQQYAFELILSSASRPQRINSETTNDITATNNAGFMLSPNPAKNYFDINLSAYKNAGNITLKLSDITGKAVLQQKMNAGAQRVYLPSLQKGLYIVTVISGKEVQNQKLVIE